MSLNPWENRMHVLPREVESGATWSAKPETEAKRGVGWWGAWRRAGECGGKKAVVLGQDRTTGGRVSDGQKGPRGPSDPSLGVPSHLLRNCIFTSSPQPSPADRVESTTTPRQLPTNMSLNGACSPIPLPKNQPAGPLSFCKPRPQAHFGQWQTASMLGNSAASSSLLAVR
ncbi:uncharacterized protein EI97DRAFT_181687 [Westerdykella ornata]|uniref:Uncharacterized protein n=1 Tax=Westerdykella ornata TaxID=318751 RepID=A0A6A6JV46_WESOR|nr:uncharacterized protein EI97DRAFT_181687 [Westerdykella ornata]KAF2279616.1 hypothetical protein EI97DRAFT_181687 [Westerdykella ornata]